MVIAFAFLRVLHCGYFILLCIFVRSMFAIALAIVSNPLTCTGFYTVTSILYTPDGRKKR